MNGRRSRELRRLAEQWVRTPQYRALGTSSRTIARRLRRQITRGA
jgi:hypothetical protein